VTGGTPLAGTVNVSVLEPFATSMYTEPLLAVNVSRVKR
jgi:hypothetical protein